MFKNRTLSLILLSLAIMLTVPTSAWAACNTQTKFHAGAYNLNYDVAGVSSYIKVRSPYNPNTIYYFNSGRVLMSVLNAAGTNYDTAEVGWRKGIPFGNSVRHYVGIWANNAWNIYNRGTPTVNSSYYYRVEHVGKVFTTRINGVVQRTDSLGTSTIASVESLGETNNNCASMGTSSVPTNLSSLQTQNYSGTWSSWTNWNEQESVPYHTDWNFWDKANIWVWGP